MAVMDATRIIKIKEGDDIWVGNRYTPRDKVKKVVRVTNTRIVLEGHAEYNTYKRVNSDRRQDAGYSYGRSWSMDYITGLAL